MSIIEERLPYLETLTLGIGSHPAPENGLVEACVMEAVAFIAGEPWSDRPKCASPVIGAFLRSWAGSLPTVDRQMLKPYIVRVVGTNTGTADDETRAWLATDWLARECAPAFMRLAGMTAEAVALEKLAPIVSARAARDGQPALDQARKVSTAARAAAWHASRDASWDPSWDASGAASWDVLWTASRAASWAAARDAAWDASGDASWDAARAASRDAAWDASRDAAWAASRDASWVAAWAALWDASWDASRDASRDALWAASRAAAYEVSYRAVRERLAPTVKQLQTSALLLLDRMVEVGK